MLTVKGTTNFSGNVNINSITVNEDTLAGDYAQEKGIILSSITLDEKIKTGIEEEDFNVKKSEIEKILNNVDLDKHYTDDNGDNGIYVNKFKALGCEIDNNDNYKVNFTADVDKSILTGKFIDEDGNETTNTNGNTDLNINMNFDTNAATVAGIYATGNQDAAGGVVNINGPTNKWTGTIYAAYSEEGSASGTINVYNNAGGSVKDEGLTLSGGNKDGNDSTLNITGFNHEFNSIENFKTINFIDAYISEHPALTVETAKLDGTVINLENLDGGQAFNEGDTLTLIAGNIEGTPTLIHDKVTAV